MSKTDAFTQALKQARLAEAAQLEAVVSLRDARSLRLLALRDALKGELEGHEPALSLFELNIQDAEKPKLWLDLISFIEMEPDPKTYRLVQDGSQGRVRLYETADALLMQDRALKHMAHRLVVHDKLAVGSGQNMRAEGRKGYGLGDLIYVWITGLLFGVLGILAWALATGVLKIL
jgi:hypothetical protein